MTVLICIFKRSVLTLGVSTHLSISNIVRIHYHLSLHISLSHTYHATLSRSIFQSHISVSKFVRLHYPLSLYIYLSDIPITPHYLVLLSNHTSLYRNSFDYTILYHYIFIYLIYLSRQIISISSQITRLYIKTRSTTLSCIGHFLFISFIYLLLGLYWYTRDNFSMGNHLDVRI